MRVAYTTVWDASGALSALDGFAELAGGSGDPGLGGFRIMRARPSQLARFKTRALRRTANMRLRASGSLSVLFIGGLALAVLAGPASCPCDPLHAALPLSVAGSDARTLSRFAYTRASEIEPARAAGERQRVAPLTKLAALVDPYESTYASAPSPISTAAIPEASTSRKPLAGLAHLGALPTTIETIAPAQPEPIRLAAVTPATDVPVPLLPVIDVVTPDAPEAPTVAAEKHAAHKHIVSKRRRTQARRARKGRSSDPAVVAAQKYAHPPRWAQQMFDNPWQSKAFSYIR
jgi:hypothetical protein